MTNNKGKAVIFLLLILAASIPGVLGLPLAPIKDAVLAWLPGRGPAPMQIGRVKTVFGTATIARGRQRLPVTPGIPVYQDDVIETGADGSIGITFIDDSVFSTGPGSQLSLSQFRFDGDTARGNMLAELKQGTLSVVSGEITHTTPGAMTIKTPTSILGVRGTTFAVEVAGTKSACSAAQTSAQPAASGEAAGCTPEERYVVLPNADGRAGAGAIVVNRDGQAMTLDQPYAGEEVRGGAAASVTMNATETDTIFQQAIAARPALPAHFRLNFLLDSDQLTPDGAEAYPAVVADIQKRQTYEVDVIGYTDTLADEAHNQRLSLDRATAIRRALVKDGVDPKAIKVEGRGEKEQLIPTARNVGEPRNRRVEVTIR